MKITTKKEADQSLMAIIQNIEQVQVSGSKNCFAIAFAVQELNNLHDYITTLPDAFTFEKKEGDAS